MVEEWKEIKDYNNYEISNMGNVRLKATKERVATRVKMPCGYVYVRLSSSNIKGKEFRVHKLVIRHFKCEAPKHNSVVGHLDNVKTNNCIDNLYWTTTQENTIKAVEDGLLKNRKGKDNDTSKKVKAVDMNGNIVGVYGSIRECARCIENITPSFISNRLKTGGNYKQSSKLYKYEFCSDEEFNRNIDVFCKQLIEIKVDRRPFEFLVINLEDNTIEKWDNQSALSRKIGISQAKISQYVRNNATVGNLRFKRLEKIDYTEASGYKTMIENKGVVRIRNIFTQEIKEFKTVVEVRMFLNIRGHLGRHSDYLILGEWEYV